MEKISVIVPTFNHADFARRALESVDGAVDYLKRQPDGRDAEVEIIVIDDGSADGTRQILEEFTRGRAAYRLILRGQSSSPSSTRNLGVSLAGGDPIFFLDGDDLFLDNHLHECLKVLRSHGDIDFVKTQISLSDPVHPEWIPRITNSVVINLCVRRRCHDLVGGFPDLHLFRRTNDRFDHQLEIFRGIEDVFYNKMIATLFKGTALALPTVKHFRRPGNSFDRQYERFQAPPGEARAEHDDLYELRVQLAKALVDHEIEMIKHKPRH